MMDDGHPPSVVPSASRSLSLLRKEAWRAHSRPHRPDEDRVSAVTPATCRALAVIPRPIQIARDPDQSILEIAVQSDSCFGAVAVELEGAQAKSFAGVVALLEIAHQSAPVISRRPEPLARADRRVPLEGGLAIEEAVECRKVAAVERLKEATNEVFHLIGATRRHADVG